MHALDGMLHGPVELSPLPLVEASLRVPSDALDEPVPRPADRLDVPHVVREDQMRLTDQRIGYPDAAGVVRLGAVAADQRTEDPAEDEEDDRRAIASHRAGTGVRAKGWKFAEVFLCKVGGGERECEVGCVLVRDGGFFLEAVKVRGDR